MKKQDTASLLRSIGERIMAFVKNELCMSARFLASAVGYAESVDKKDLASPVPVFLMATNGTLIVYDSKGLLDAFEKDPKNLVRTYTHLIFHCLYRHFAKAGLTENSQAWHVASDIAAEYLTDKLGVDAVREPAGEQLRKVYYERFEKTCPLLSAEYVYEEIKFLSQTELKDMGKIFSRDEHVLWVASGGQNTSLSTLGGEQAGAQNQNNEGERETPEPNQGDREAPQLMPVSGEFDFDVGSGAWGLRGSSREQIKLSQEDWARIAQRVKLEIESFAQEYGDQTADLRRIINVELRSTYDYKEFLRKFMVLKELIQEDLSQFDYIYYNLGLTMYGNLPLYDHLEYALDYALEDFVIAVDSSGSVFYDLAVNFLEECYSIVAQATSLRRRINLHIIQCDAAIKEDVLITGYDDFTKFIKRFTLRGGGGTDFRPVFNHVNKLKEDGKLPNLKGMVYFTDGLGKYPEKPPPYDVAFVFYGNNKKEVETPPWAMKLIIAQTTDKKEV